MATARVIFRKERPPAEAGSALEPERDIMSANATATRIAAVRVEVTILTSPIESEPNH